MATKERVVELGSEEAPEVRTGVELEVRRTVHVDGRSLRALEKRATDTLTEILNTETRRMELYRALAETMVKIRALYQDWGGTSQAYREVAARIYSKAGVPTDSTAGIQAAVRYHISGALREIAPPKELEAIGLHPESARERSTSRKRQLRRFASPTAGQAVRPDMDEFTLADDALREGMAMIYQAEQLVEKGALKDLATVLEIIKEMKGELESLRKKAVKAA